MVKVFAFFLFSIIGAVTYAQPDLDMVNERASQLIDSVMQRINLRAEIFNEETSKVNKLRPLEVENLSREKIEANIPIIKEFLSYLEVYRSISDKEQAEIADSIALLRSYIPKSKQKKYLKDFADAYALDQSAFNKYTLALTGLYTNVVDLLNFLLTAKTEIKDEKITFQDRKEYQQYEKIMTKIEKQVSRQGKAGLASQKASYEAGEIMHKAYGKLHQ